MLCLCRCSSAKRSGDVEARAFLGELEVGDANSEEVVLRLERELEAADVVGRAR
jgi:hypothetical protein